EPNRGRVFVLRRDRTIVGMINLLFTISTAEGGFVILLEDLVVHDSFRGHGYGSQLLEYAINFARQKKFLRITLLTDRPELRSQNFFKRHGFFESHMLPMRLLIAPDAPATTLSESALNAGERWAVWKAPLLVAKIGARPLIQL